MEIPFPCGFLDFFIDCGFLVAGSVDGRAGGVGSASGASWASGVGWAGGASRDVACNVCTRGCRDVPFNGWRVCN